MTEYLCIREGKVGTDFGDVSKMVEGRFDHGGDVGIKGEVAVKKYTKASYCGGRQQQTVSEVQGSYIEILKLSFRSY